MARHWPKTGFKLGLGVALGLTLLYLNTAVITGGGGFQVRLAYKPWHGLHPFYRPSSGEEGSWHQLTDGPTPPWWVTGDYRQILVDSSEGGTPLWLWLYRYGYRGLPLLWLVGVGLGGQAWRSSRDR